ncbi:MAG: DnaJ domain-containing protein [Pyrinomonadaceae bacterium]|nr:DnaJ domain-containing protein [Pyrinomonadaceae bacterium]
MTTQNKLEIKGSLSSHSPAELLTEFSLAGLSGSLRFSNNERKMIVYLESGTAVFAVSNLREHRLFNFVVSDNILSNDELSKIRNFANDVEFATYLIEKQIATAPVIRDTTLKQLSQIFNDVLAWNDGEWMFSSLTRVKNDLHLEIDLPSILIEFARSRSELETAERFSSGEESFGIKPESPFHLDLRSEEAFVLSRFDQGFLTLDQIDTISGLPVNSTRKILYTLWMGGFLYRKNWNSVISESRIEEMLGAKLSRIEKDVEVNVLDTAISEPESLPDKSSKEVEDALKAIEDEQKLYEYLERIEAASTLYEAIGVETEAETSAIKQSYFAQAKKYHPDLFHKNEELHIRVQSAFTHLAHAYETLKEKESRDLYNFKMRKELAEQKSRADSGMSEQQINLNKQLEKAAENFQWGMNLLDEDEYVEAIPFFARAVHYDSSIAKYHAFYGKALSFQQKNLHQAESELQTAIKIEPNNTMFRMMLAELFVHIGLRKRAEGELNKILSVTPNDIEARKLLESLA